MEKKYTPLHVHSMYSLLDGLSKPSQIAQRCKSIEASACAITDHGTISGCVKFHETMKKNKIKPILGCELYISNENAKTKNNENKKLSHLLVLAQNYDGWRNLIQVVSASNDPDRYYYKPRLSLEELGDLDTSNLLCIGGHLGSVVANEIVVNDQIDDNWQTKGENVVSKLVEIFGKDRVFLESQLIDKQILKIQEELTNCIRKIGHNLGVKIICTPDAHYCNKEDAYDQRILLCNNLKTTLPEVNTKILNGQDCPLSTFFVSDNYHIPSQEEMRQVHTEEELENTLYVESLCEDYEISKKPSLPKFNCPDNFTEEEYLRHLCRKGWRDKNLNSLSQEKIDEYVKRINYELEVLQNANLSSYFLIVQDIVRHIKSQKWLPGPGRGSASGCLVSYLIGITAIDPLNYGLIFDRFYNAGRNSADHISMPDIDIDVPINKREDIIEYIKSSYGKDKVSQMITFNTMKGRGALKDVLRVYGNVSFNEMNMITKNIADEAKIADELQIMKEETGESSIIRWALENSSKELKPWCHIDSNGDLQGPLAKRFEQAIRLEGTKTNQSKHAAGIAVSSDQLAGVCPMIYDTKNKQMIAGMEMQDLETLGVVKLDILGVAVLDKIMTINNFINGDK